MVVNLDVLFDPKNWPKDLSKQPKGLAVLDNCLGKITTTVMPSLTTPNVSDKSLVRQSHQPSSPVLGPKSRTPRKKSAPSKLQQYVIVKAPSGICPKCRIYVKEGGVACDKCQAYWHYTCVGVTEQEVEEKWNGIPFLCPMHQEVPTCLEATDVMGEEEKVEIKVKVHSYTLNPEITVKKLLSSLNIKLKIEPRDDYQQYHLKLCPPSFELLVANMGEFGKQWGVSIKGGGFDNRGTRVGTQFNVELTTQSGLTAAVSMNCHSTNSSVHLLLNKGTKELGGWEDKKACFSHFVTHTLKNALTQVEMTDEFIHLKERMKNDLEESRSKMIEVKKDLAIDKNEQKQSHMDEVFLAPEQIQCQSQTHNDPTVDNTHEDCPSPSKGSRKRTSESSLRIQSLEKEKAVLLQKVETLTTHQETLRSTIASKNDTLETQTKLVSDQREQISKQKQQIEELKISSATHNQFADSFLNCLAAAEESNEVLLMENEKNVKQQLYGNIKEKDSHIETLNNKISQLQDEVQKLSAENEKSVLVDKYNEVVKKLQSKNKENTALVNQVAKVEATVLSGKKELDAVVMKLNDTENENTSLRNDLDMLRKNLTASEQCVERTKEDLDQLNKSIENPEIHQMYKQLAEQVLQKDEEIANLQESIAYSEKSVIELKLQVQEKDDPDLFHPESSERGINIKIVISRKIK